MNTTHYLLAPMALGLAPAGFTSTAMAQPAPLAAALTYADLVDLAEPAEAVVRVQIRKQATVEPERSPGLKPGFVRLYIEATTLALLKGPRPVGESLRYLVDVPLDAKGKAPKLKKQDVLLITRASSARPGEVALLHPDSQIAWSAEVEARLRPILADLAQADVRPAIASVREALSVQGNLVGESETQYFLATADRELVSITVVRRPAMPPVWGVAWDEIVDQAAAPPQRDTIECTGSPASCPRPCPGRPTLHPTRARGPGPKPTGASSAPNSGPVPATGASARPRQTGSQAAPPRSRAG